MIYNNKTLLFCVFLLIAVALSDGYKILAIFAYNAKSHNVMFNPLVKELASRGHQVDVITHFPIKNAPPNYKVVVNLDGTLPRIVNNFTIDFILSFRDVGVNVLSEQLGNSVCHQILALTSLQNFIKDLPNNPSYDLVIVEAFAANCFFGFGHLLQVPVVAVSSAIEYPWISSFIGNDDNLAYVVTSSLSIFEKMTFWERLYNFYLHKKEEFTFQSLTEQSQTEAMRKYISPDIPNIREVEKSVALTLINSHPVIFGVKPIIPSLVQVGGLHIGQEKLELSSEMEKWLDESSDGLVYFTFGSMALIESLPMSTLQNIFKTFKSIAPIRVLMKVVDKQKLPPRLPPNVLTSPWIPQETVLAHKNVRLFITHSGLMGSQEALYYGVPMVGVPLFGDQFRNAAAFVTKNMSIKLTLDDLKTDAFGKAMRAVLSNPKYRSSAKLYSKLFRDRPMTAMDTAIYWIEYTIRNDPSVLRSPAFDLQWWELAQLDIYAFFFVSVTVLLILTYCIVNFFIRKLFYSFRVKIKTTRNNFQTAVISINRRQSSIIYHQQILSCTFELQFYFMTEKLNDFLILLLLVFVSVRCFPPFSVECFSKCIIIYTSNKLEMLRAVSILFLTVIVLDQSSAYRVLGIFPLNGKSHEMMFEALMKGLAKRGHQVDVITHFPIKNPPINYRTLVNLSGTMENLINSFSMDFVLGMADEVGYHVATAYGNRLCDLMNLKEIQEVIHNPPTNPPYDVLITEAFGANCFMGIGYHFNIPIVAASSALEYPWVSDFTGNNDNPAVVPNALFMAFGQMNFWQRLKNTIIYYNEIWKFHKLTEHSQTESMRKYINSKLPNIREIERSVALTLVNSHSILYGVKPVLPTLVQVGGLHVEENDSKLSKELLKWMDESKDGVVYFTFGSMVVVESLSKDILKIIYASFAKIAPTRVLMKVANATNLPPGLPNNILHLPWIPQQAVLAHKNTKAFITHGGLMGSQEALYYGVPMIGVPLFADQPRNVEAFVAKNMSIKLPLKDVSEKTLDAALQAILFDSKYRKSAKYYSKLFKDRPLSAMDTAVYWIEYVIRNGPNIMRSPSLNLTWWQLALLDVYTFILLVFILSNIILYFISKFVLKIMHNAVSGDVLHEKKIR
ncbi:uncharacterized protein LOC131671920 [Phymastichus coffea]|uniref:uncharacterized protein LOC131671920 n=1 Tax=Phymastichus coffea TaxID=108790 RepID=UPI00273CCF03|nr:uncharacterized protein LOC131671920 [Phymastichus coffea]